MALIEAPEGGGGNTPDNNNDESGAPAAADRDAAALVKEQVNVQMSTATSPESKLAFSSRRCSRRRSTASPCPSPTAPRSIPVHRTHLLNLLARENPSLSVSPRRIRIFQHDSDAATRSSFAS